MLVEVSLEFVDATRQTGERRWSRGREGVGVMWGLPRVWTGVRLRAVGGMSGLREGLDWACAGPANGRRSAARERRNEGRRSRRTALRRYCRRAELCCQACGRRSGGEGECVP